MLNETVLNRLIQFVPVVQLVLLFNKAIYSYFEKGCRKNVYATILKGNMGYDKYLVSNDCSCRTYSIVTFL